MDINNRIQSIQEYFKEMQIVTVNDKNIIYMTIQLPHKWVTPDDLMEKFHVDILNEHEVKMSTPGTYYFYIEASYGYDMIFDAIEYTINKNKEAEARVKLFKEKMSELEDIFMDENNTLSQLENMTFVLGKNKNKKTTIKSVIKESIKENITECCENNENEVYNEIIEEETECQQD